MRIVRRPTATAIYDLDGTQNWLDDMASQGLILESWGKYFCTFRKRDPDPNKRYYLEPIHPRETKNSFLSLRRNMRDQGWSYICRAEHRYYIFATWDPFAPEMETDANPLIYATSCMLRESLKGALLRFLILMIAGILLLRSISLPPGVTQMVRNWGPLTPVLLLLVPVSMILSFSAIPFILRILSALREDRVLPRSSRKERTRLHISRWLAPLVLVLMLFDAAVMRHYWSSSMSWEISDLPVNCLQLSELEDNPEFVLTPMGENLANTSNGMWRPSFWSPVHVVIRQYGTVPDTKGSGARSLVMELWHTRGKFGAQSLSEEIPEQMIQYNREKSLRTDWSERTIYYTSPTGQFLLFRKSNRLLIVQYEGNADLTEYLDQFQALLEADWYVSGS